jgi:hypothetical protein
MESSQHVYDPSSTGRLGKAHAVEEPCTPVPYDEGPPLDLAAYP